ncbi:MAG: hypothetical protein KDA96_27760, partial [Planctomycetaceae bacterium]|nr:hypothetical protein [Planctomycetaceae bacterium]
PVRLRLTPPLHYRALRLRVAGSVADRGSVRGAEPLVHGVPGQEPAGARGRGAKPEFTGLNPVAFLI